MRRFLVFLLAVPFLTGCGGVDGSLFATAVHSTQAAGGAEVAFQATMEMPGMGQPFTMTGSGVVDAEAQRAQMTMDMPNVGQMEIRSDHLVTYMHSDLFSAALGGKEWLKLDIARATKSLGIDLQSMTGGQSSPAEQLKMLEQVSGGIHEEGHEQVRGVDTTHYSATIDMHKYPGGMGDKLIELTGQSEIPMDVWIDDQKRVRRMEWDQSIRPQGGNAQVSMKMVMEFVRFGVPVNVDIPSDDEVFDATDLGIQSMQQNLNR